MGEIINNGYISYWTSSNMEITFKSNYLYKLGYHSDTITSSILNRSVESLYPNIVVSDVTTLVL